MKEYDTVIIGAGPAGLAAAIGAAKENGEILLFERGEILGGVLNQCIHPGFGTKNFKEELTGPEYAERYINELGKYKNITTLLKTTVLSIECKNMEITYLNCDGIFKIKTKAIIFATGCLEKGQGSIKLPSKRQSGIMTAGVAQKYVNLMGYLPGKEVVILGSGDIGLIMARRLHLEGANVKMVLEIMPESSGLKRNIVQCLDDFNIPLKLSHTVFEVVGDERVEGIYYGKVDDNLNPIFESKKFIKCDTLILSVGLVPYNILLENLKIEFNTKTRSPYVNQFYETKYKNIYVCGNSLHVNDLVDNVSAESEIAGKYSIINSKLTNTKNVLINLNGNIQYIIPSMIDFNNIIDKIIFSFRCLKKAERAKFIIKSENIIIFEREVKNLIPSEIKNIIVAKRYFDNLKDDLLVEVL